MTKIYLISFQLKMNNEKKEIKFFANYNKFTFDCHFECCV